MKNTVNLQTSIPKELFERLKLLARQEGRSISNLVAWMLKKAIRNIERGE